MNSQVLESTVQKKDLGVMITNCLKSGGNCQAAYKKANRVLGMNDSKNYRLQIC